jgi:hypothetical protein
MAPCTDKDCKLKREAVRSAAITEKCLEPDTDVPVCVVMVGMYITRDHEYIYHVPFHDAEGNKYEYRLLTTRIADRQQIGTTPYFIVAASGDKKCHVVTET